MTQPVSGGTSSDGVQGFPTRPWQRISVRLAAVLALATLIAVGLVGALVYVRQKRTLEETQGVQLLNIARTGVLLVDPLLHAEVQRTWTADSDAYRAVRGALAAIRAAAVLPTPVYTLADYDARRRQARFVVTSDGPGQPGEPYPLAPELVEPLGWTLADGFARFTPIYRNQSGTWITAFAPILDPAGRIVAVLDVDYPVELYLDRLAEVRTTILQASILSALAMLGLGLVMARRLTRPIRALTRGVARVAGGDLSQPLPVRSRDEVGQLTRAFNAMIEGLRQRDLIRDTLGRYVSPEVARTLLESPEGLRLGGAKREITILMSDLRGYTRFVDQGAPEVVVAVLNAYLGRMTEIIVEHGGTINEFVGDGIVAFFGAPLPDADHPERAAACALAMQIALDGVNRRHAAEGLPRLEMGIGLNTGEAIVGNVGSEQRAKYTAVGTAINLAARVEACTVGGQILLSPFTYARIRELAEVGPPIPVEVKGLREPLLLYELRALAGRYAYRLPDVDGGAQEDLVTPLPATYWLIEGKTVLPDPQAAEVVRIGSRRLTLRLAAPIAPLQNVRLRLRLLAVAQESEDIYGKVVEVTRAEGAWLAQVALTSIQETDRQILETPPGAASAGPDARAPDRPGKFTSP